MDIQTPLQELHKQLSSESWYVNSKQDSSNSIVVYVSALNQNISSKIPLKINNYNIKVHYAASLCNSGYVDVVNLVSEKELSDIDVYAEILNLTKFCNKQALIDIFYEIHDQDDAVTGLSEQFPEVRAKLEELYNEFGFDVLYDSLEI